MEIPLFERFAVKRWHEIPLLVCHNIVLLGNETGVRIQGEMEITDL